MSTVKNRLDEIFETTKNSVEYCNQYAAYMSKLLLELDYSEVSKFLAAVLEARERGSFIFFIGNGGSAATASHYANDLSIGTRVDVKPFKAMSLTDNIPVLTALANDDGYEHIFTKQLKNFASKDDLLVAISASGNSPNIIQCVEYAKQKGLKVVGLTGFDGGKLRELSDIKIHVETRKGEYGPVEDVHMYINHVLGSYINRHVKL